MNRMRVYQAAALLLLAMIVSPILCRAGDDDIEACSPDGRRLARVERDGSLSIIDLRSPGQIEMLIPGLRAQPHGLCWSGDGRRIFYVSSAAGTLDLWQISPETRQRTPLRVTPWRESHPALLPGGDRIAFISDENGADDLWILELRTRRAYPLTDDEAGESPIRSSLKTHASVFASRRLGGESAIVLVKWPEGDLFTFRLPERFVNAADISADGTRIAWSSADVFVEAAPEWNDIPKLRVLRRIQGTKENPPPRARYKALTTPLSASLPVRAASGDGSTPKTTEIQTPAQAYAAILRCIESLPERDALQWRIGHFPSRFEENARTILKIAEKHQDGDWARVKQLARACLVFRTEEMEAILQEAAAIFPSAMHSLAMGESFDIINFHTPLIRFLLANVYQSEGRYKEALNQMRLFCLEWSDDEAVAYVAAIDALLSVTSRYPYVVDRWMRAERLARLGPWAFWRIVAQATLGPSSAAGITQRHSPPGLCSQSAPEDELIRDAIAEYLIIETRYRDLEQSSWALFRLATHSPSWARMTLYRRYFYGRRRDMFFLPALESLVDFAAANRRSGSAYEMLRGVNPDDEALRAAVFRARERLLRDIMHGD